MGAGASTADKLELQRAYAAWEEATAPGKPTLTNEGFLKLLETGAPTLHQKATASGSGAAAEASLKSQFESAKQKLQMPSLGKSSGRNSRQPSGSAPAPPPLRGAPEVRLVVAAPPLVCDVGGTWSGYVVRTTRIASCTH